MADSDKDILITPNTGVASTHPKITFTGKDNSPVDLKILDDNTLSFEGVQGQVFSISPILNSGDIFSVNDISGIQSVAVNADGTITLNPTNSKKVEVTGDIRLTGDIYVAENKRIYFDSTDTYIFADTDSSEDLHIGADGHIELEADGDVIIEAGSTEYARFDGSSQRVGIGTNSPAAKLHVDAGTTIAPSLTFGAVAGQIFQNENSELAIGLDNDSPYSLWLQARTSGNAARDISLQPLGGKIGIGTEAPTFPLDVNGFISTTDGIVHTGDTNNTISFGTDTQSFNTAGSTRLHITNAGHVIVGATSYSGTSSHAGLEVSHATQANLRVTDSSASASSDFAQSENDLYIVNRKSGGNMRFRVGGSTETILMDSDGDIKFANGATSSWATWNSVVFYRHSYGNTTQSGLYVSNDSATGIQKQHMIPFTAKIRAVAFHFNGTDGSSAATNVDYSSTTNNSWNIFRAGQTGDSLATVTFNNGQGTRLQSGGSNVNHLYYVVTGLNISVAAGDTVHIRRESGSEYVGNVRVEIFYSHV